jgi:hypothetical protein
MGTATVAQSNPPPQDRHTIGTGGGSATVVVVVGGTVVVGAAVVVTGGLEVDVGASAVDEHATSIVTARIDIARRAGIVAR